MSNLGHDFVADEDSEDAETSIQLLEAEEAMLLQSVPRNFKLNHCPWSPCTRPGKRLRNELERSTMLLMGKSTNSTGPFSIAFCMFTRG